MVYIGNCTEGLDKFFQDGIGLDDCEKVSLAVSALLDVEDPLPGQYNLEVSSPGLDRTLKKVEHFQRFVGEEVKVQMRFPIEGRKRFLSQRSTRLDWYPQRHKAAGLEFR